MAEDGKTPTLIVPKVTTDHLRSFLARMPLEVYSDYGRRHFKLFTHVLHRFLGQEWVEKHILAQALGINKGPTAFLEVDFSTDERRELGSLRLFDLAEMLMNLQLVEGFSECIDRLRTGKRDQIEATYAELQFAKLFYVHDMQFRIMVPSGERRSSYDFEIFLPSHPVVCADAKCKIEANNIDPASVRNTLDSARDQFPKDKPGVIFVKVPQHWFARPGMTADLRKVARDFLRGTGRIVSVKYYVSHVTFINQQTVHRHAFDEIDNPNNRFPPNRNWDFFRGYHVPDEWNGMPPKWIRLMHFK
jgi:hypothetical protein